MTEWYGGELRGATKHLLTSAERTSDLDEIFVRNERGPPIKLQKITDTRVDSKEASKRTVRNRAKSHEKFERRTSCISSTRASGETISENLLTQRAAQMKRDGVGYGEALKKAKFMVHTKFSRKTVLQIKALMPMTLFKKVSVFSVKNVDSITLGQNKNYTMTCDLFTQDIDDITGDELV